MAKKRSKRYNQAAALIEEGKSYSLAEAVETVRAATDLTSSVAPWLLVDHDNLTGKILRAPEREEYDQTHHDWRRAHARVDQAHRCHSPLKAPATERNADWQPDR